MKNVNKKIVATFAVMLSVSANAYDKKDEAKIKQKVNQVITGVKQKNTDMILDTMPQKLFGFLAKKAKMTPQKAKEMMKKMTDRGMQDLPVDKMKYEVIYSKARINKSSTNREYVIFPTKTVFDMDSQLIKSTGNLVAIEDDNNWYIMRIENAQQTDILKQIYPDIKKYDIYKTTTEVKEK